MINVTNIESLSNFQKNAKAVMAKLIKSKQPVVLTVNGKAKVVVQDAAAYQELADEVEQARFIAAVREGLKEIKEGKGIPFDEFAAELEEEYGL